METFKKRFFIRFKKYFLPLKKKKTIYHVFLQIFTFCIDFKLLESSSTSLLRFLIHKSSITILSYHH